MRCYVNVYAHGSKVIIGYGTRHKYESIEWSEQAVRRGFKLLYRLIIKPKTLTTS